MLASHCLWAGKGGQAGPGCVSGLPSPFPKSLPTPLVRPQPVVTQVRPAGSASFEEARQTGEIRCVYRAGEASFKRVTSLFIVVGFQLGCVMAYGARESQRKLEQVPVPRVGTEG